LIKFRSVFTRECLFSHVITLSSCTGLSPQCLSLVYRYQKRRSLFTNVGLFSQMYVSFHKFRSLCTHQSLCSDVRILSAMFKSSVQVSRCRSLFTNVGLFSQMYVSFHKCRSLFTNVGLFFKCRSLFTNVDLLQVSRGVCMCICICIYVHMYRTLFAMFKPCSPAYRCVYV